MNAVYLLFSEQWVTAAAATFTDIQLHQSTPVTRRGAGERTRSVSNGSILCSRSAIDTSRQIPQCHRFSEKVRVFTTAL